MTSTLPPVPTTVVCFGQPTEAYRKAIAHAHKEGTIEAEFVPSQPPAWNTSLVGNFLHRHRPGTWFYLNCATDCIAWKLNPASAKYRFGFAEMTITERLRLYWVGLNGEIELVYEEGCEISLQQTGQADSMSATAN